MIPQTPIVRRANALPPAAEPSAAWEVGPQQDTWCKLKGFLPVGPISVGPPVAYVFGAEEAAKIAAAPDLLDSLRTMMALVRLKYGNLDAEVNSALSDAEAAIAKSETKP
jgi:hypothetical protein